MNEEQLRKEEEKLVAKARRVARWEKYHRIEPLETTEYEILT